MLFREILLWLSAFVAGLALVLGVYRLRNLVSGNVLAVGRLLMDVGIAVQTLLIAQLLWRTQVVPLTWQGVAYAAALGCITLGFIIVAIAISRGKE